MCDDDFHTLLNYKLRANMLYPLWPQTAAILTHSSLCNVR